MEWLEGDPEISVTLRITILTNPSVDGPVMSHRLLIDERGTITQLDEP